MSKGQLSPTQQGFKAKIIVDSGKGDVLELQGKVLRVSSGLGEEEVRAPLHPHRRLRRYTESLSKGNRFR
jgi:hypothetical protein